MFSLPFHTKRSILIQKPISEVFDFIANFENWKSWSPWLCQEPDCPTNITGHPQEVDHSQSWDGRRIGTGNMKLVSLEAPQSLKYEINFLKPWKSHSKVEFQLNSSNGQTEVTWLMDGTVPIFMFFLRKMMSAWVGSDYDRGLNMLKDILETGVVHSKVEVKEQDVQQDSFHYLGKYTSCAISDIGPMMEKDFQQLNADVQEGKVTEPDIFFSFYHKWDLVNGRCEYTAGLGYKNKPKENSSYKYGHIREHQAFNVNHIGSYKHLGNAWSTLIGCQRSLKKKAAKDISMYEVYANDPNEVAEKDLVTQLYLPLKG